MIPGIAQLERTPELLRILMEGLSEADTRWKPAPEKWSISEVLEHLSHTEGHYFRDHAERIVNEENPAFEAYDQEALAAAGQYTGRDPEDSLDHFETQREVNLEYLRELPESALARTGGHPDIGLFTLENLLNEWAFHDLGHIRQIAELIRGLKYRPNLGAIATWYGM
jgi:hypothetical protein